MTLPGTFVRRTARSNAFWGVLVAVVGGVLGLRVFLDANYLFFYQNFLPEIVYAVCGHGFVRPLVIEGALKAFLLQQTPAFDCAELSLEALGPQGYFASIQPALNALVSALWSPPILEIAELWPLPLVASAALAGGGFVLLRLFLPLGLAVAGALLLAASPVALSLVLSFRDYVKAPFFLWAIAFLVLALRSQTLARGMIFAAFAGVVIGLGVGFRIDLTILIPIGVVALAFVTRVRLIPVRAAAALSLAIVAVGVGWPVLSGAAPSVAGSPLLQGLSEPFRAYLGLDAAPYTFGDRYSDELTLSSVAAAERPTTPNWDAGRTGAADWPVAGHDASDAARDALGAPLRRRPRDARLEDRRLDRGPSCARRRRQSGIRSRLAGPVRSPGSAVARAAL